MVEVPAGSVSCSVKSKDTVSIDQPYWIDIYPVTNARYREFVEAGGYETEKWWDTGGWKWREEERIIRPSYWDKDKWNRDNHPVVGVSWYEAAAYCKWLSEISKDGHFYHLPTEKQWERAARGTEGLEYPWGDKFDSGRCNTEESGKDKTTRVDLYADGLSPVGCYDMAGNVWEWTSEFFDSDQDSYVLKGGSWSDPAVNARCAYRYDFIFPFIRDSFVGFRCARTLK